MSNTIHNTTSDQLPLIRKKMIESLIVIHSELRYLCYAKLYTCSIKNPKWLYSELEGGLALTINHIEKCGKFTLYDSTTYEIIFESELYKRFNGNFQKITDNFYCFEVDGGFIGFYIPNKEDGLLLAHEVSELSDSFILKKLKDHRLITEQTLRAIGEEMISKVKTKLAQNSCIKEQPRIPIMELTIKGIEKDFNPIGLDERNKRVLLGGNGNDVEMLFRKIRGIDIAERNKVKIGNKELYSKAIATNVYNILKQENLRDDLNKFREQMRVNTLGRVLLLRVNAFQTDMSIGLSDKGKEKESDSIGKNHPQIQPQQPIESIKQPKNKPQYIDAPVVKMAKVNEAGKGGIPLPPLLPPMDLTIPVVPKVKAEPVKAPVSASSIDLQAELEEKKKKLVKVEIKEPVSSALKREDEQSMSQTQENRGGGNEMKNELMRMLQKRGNFNFENLEKKKPLDTNDNTNSSTGQNNRINPIVKPENIKAQQSNQSILHQQQHQHQQLLPVSVEIPPKVEITLDKKGIPVPPPMNFPQVAPPKIPSGMTIKKKPAKPKFSNATMADEIAKGVKLMKVTTQEKFGIDYQKEKKQQEGNESTTPLTTINANTDNAVGVNSNESNTKTNLPFTSNIPSGGQQNFFSMLHGVQLKKVGDAKIEPAKPKVEPVVTSSSPSTTSESSSVFEKLKAINQNLVKQGNDKSIKPPATKYDEVKPLDTNKIPQRIMMPMTPSIKEEDAQETKAINNNPLTTPMMTIPKKEVISELKPQETKPLTQIQQPIPTPTLKVEIKTNSKGIPVPPPMDFPKPVAQPKTAPATTTKPNQTTQHKSSGLTMAEEIAKGVQLKKVSIEEKFGINYQKDQQEGGGGDNNNSSNGQNFFLSMLKGVQLKKIPKDN